MLRVCLDESKNLSFGKEVKSSSKIRIVWQKATPSLFPETFPLTHRMFQKAGS